MQQFAPQALGHASPLLLGRAISTLVTFGLPLILVRVLTPDGFGEYKQYFLVLQTVLLIGQLGLTQSLYYFLPRGGPTRGAYVSQSVLALGGLGVVVAAVLYLGNPLLESWLNSPALGAAGLPLALSAAAVLVTASLEPALIGEQRLAWAAAAYALSDTARALALVVAAVLFGEVAIFWAAALVSWLRVLGLALLLLRRIVPTARPLAGAWRAQLRFAIPFAFAGLLHVAQRNFGQYAVSVRFDPATFALFSVASFHLAVLNLVFTPISDVLTVRLGQVIGSKSNAPLTDWDDAVARLATALLPATCAAFVVGPVLLPFLFTTAYTQAVPLFLLASLELVLWIVPTDSLLWASGQTRLLFLANAMRLAMTIVGVVVGVGTLGLAGAIVGGLVAELAYRIFMLAQGSRVLNVHPAAVVDWPRLTRIGIAALLAAIPARILVSIDVPPGATLVLAGTGYALVYVLLLLAISGGSRSASVGSGSVQLR